MGMHRKPGILRLALGHPDGGGDGSCLLLEVICFLLMG